MSCDNKLDLDDLSRVDLNYARSLQVFSDQTSHLLPGEDGSDQHLLLPSQFFDGISFSGKSKAVCPAGNRMILRLSQCKQYAKAAINQR